MVAIPYRTGLPTVIKYADLLCAALVKHKSTIMLLDPDNTDLETAIDNLVAACIVAGPLFEAIRQYGD